MLSFKILRSSKWASVHLSRQYTTKAKRVVLSQDQSKIKNYEPKTTDAHANRVYVWGFQETGALGLQTNVKKAKERYTEMVHHPTRLQFSNNNEITDVTAGYGFTAYAVKRSDGLSLFGSGLNTDSQLGYQVKGNKKDPANLDVIIYPTAIQLPRLQGETDEDMQVKSMSAGRAHLVVLTQNGTVFTMGNNSYGQCGRSIIEEEKYSGSALINRIAQRDICGADDELVAVECGQDHTMLLSKLGRVYTCGWGADGQTGQGNYYSAGQITLIGGDIEKERIVRIACASDCVLALNEKGDVFGWGNSEYGQLDDAPDAVTQICTPRALTLTKGLGKVKDVAAGGSFCMALNDQGLVYTWGYGILGFGPFVEQTSKPQHLLPPLFGRNDFSNATTVVSIGCGVFHMGAVNSDGDLFMWGKNRFGHLGLGHKKDQFFPFKAAINGKVLKVAYGVDHTIALCKPHI
ncbi:PREDICTED: Williams-Beuren syndrome chromosomal region 16 protein homolog [Drosophila arizonae]|uniref:Williams-Beuren syndrome chromosomal region 16 protein homolog n=1 Tax=Drosophila arizonae TaxID=7263 RepID=A0ABM1NTI6_DROAR|nr:PREDICTED: Williams-Beuren syndrome chromosomal region 16 protein homolog [Drosophila arizonae]